VKTGSDFTDDFSILERCAAIKIEWASRLRLQYNTGKTEAALSLADEATENTSRQN
jgi:hypothetical protein